MHTRRDFLAAIRASPDDDTLRLVYADWLQENGEDDRAQYIRQWISGDSQGLHKLFMSALHKKFTSTVGDKWAEAANPAMDRGFVESLFASWIWWLTNGDRLLETELVPKVILSNDPSIEFDNRTYEDRDVRKVVLTRTARTGRNPGDKKVSKQVAVDRYEIDHSRLEPSEVMRLAQERLDRSLTVGECLRAWWPEVYFPQYQPPRSAPASGAESAGANSGA